MRYESSSKSGHSKLTMSNLVWQELDASYNVVGASRKLAVSAAVRTETLVAPANF